MTFATVYGFTENFMLPLSHDEVVYGKQSLIYKMPGDEWQKFANLRSLYLYMFTFIGTKLLFMGGEFGQTSEWNVNQSLDWHLLQYKPHSSMKDFVGELNKVYKSYPALYEKAFSPEGFFWIELGDRDNSIFAYCRRGHDLENDLVVVLNLTPIVRHGFKLGVPHDGQWELLLNSDDPKFNGSGVKVKKVVKSEKEPWMGQEQSIVIDLPPLSGLIFKRKLGK
jgi:1,4-alpha-glucan branching enzyme